MSICSITKLRSTIFLYRTLYFNKHKFLIIYNLNATCMKWDFNLTFPPLYMHFPQVYALNNLSFPLGLWWFLCFYHSFAVICQLGKKMFWDESNQGEADTKMSLPFPYLPKNRTCIWKEDPLSSLSGVLKLTTGDNSWPLYKHLWKLQNKTC